MVPFFIIEVRYTAQSCITEGIGGYYMLSDIELAFCDYLENERTEFLLDWKKQLIVSDNDPFRDEILVNGEKLLILLKALVMEEMELKDMQPMCDKIASERVKAEANIGDFVYNTNIGRNALFEKMCTFDAKAIDLLPLIDKVHRFFDHLTYYTVLRYSSIIAENLQNQQRYISETHKDRLTILGQMSASFVHEFRNPLTSIMGFVKLLRDEHSSLPYLDIISHEIEQLNFRISQFLLVSKRETSEQKEKFLLNDMFYEIIHFLYPSIVDKNVKVQEEISMPIEMAGYRGELRQVFLNVLMNSIDALESIQEDRKITISTWENMNSIDITIQNNGPMIPRDQIEMIFEPFVTSKKLGTGIGLFVCKQIVEKHDGQIICESTEEYTSFHITFQKYII